MDNQSFVLLPDIPAGLELGVDCISYETGPRLKGISLLPVGIHFIYHNVGMGMKQGFFIDIEPGDIHIFPWNAQEEEISSTYTCTDEMMNSLKQQIYRGDLNQYLGPYPHTQHRNWLNLSSFISLSVLNKTSCPLYKIIYSESPPISATYTSTSTTAINNISTNAMYTSDNSIIDDNHMPTFIDINTQESIYNEVLNKLDNKTYLLTINNMDKSNFIQYMIDTNIYTDYQHLLGELQLSFLLFILIYSYTSLNHWKNMINILCKCEYILKYNTTFSISFIRILYEQLNYIPTDLFEAEISRENFLLPALTNLFNNTSSTYASSSTNTDNNTTSGGSLNTHDNTNGGTTGGTGGGGGGGSMSKRVVENRRRLLLFVQKKFNLFTSDTGGSGGDGEGGGGCSYLGRGVAGLEEYCVDDEDMPVIVSEEEAAGSTPYTHASAMSTGPTTATGTTAAATGEGVGGGGGGGGGLAAQWSGRLDESLQQHHPSYLATLTHMSSVTIEDYATYTQQGGEDAIGQGAGEGVYMDTFVDTGPDVSSMSSVQKQNLVYSWRYVRHTRICV